MHYHKIKATFNFVASFKAGSGLVSTWVEDRDRIPGVSVSGCWWSEGLLSQMWAATLMLVFLNCDNCGYKRCKQATIYLCGR